MRRPTVLLRPGSKRGEHRLKAKNLPYEQSLKVPLLVRGPALPAGAVRGQLFGMVDLAPTFVALARARTGRVVDGRSMMATLHSGAGGYRSYLMQATREGRWWWRGVRSERYVYVRYAGGFQELYDLTRDPAQLRNVASNVRTGMSRPITRDGLPRCGTAREAPAAPAEVATSITRLPDGHGRLPFDRFDINGAQVCLLGRRHHAQPPRELGSNSTG